MVVTAWLFTLPTSGCVFPPHTIRHILHRLRPPQKRRRRKPLYSALWAWDEQEPFSLLQSDVKDIRDKQALGTERTTHRARLHLPRYQWTAIDSRTRLRFLAYSHRCHRTNGLAFLVLVLLWLRAHGVEGPVTFQTDWGDEFGGDNPERVAELSHRFPQPLGGQLCRYPLGRKGHNGRVERSHRTDDEEFYHPYLLQMYSWADFCFYGQRWVYFYNTLRPHYGKGMAGSPPLAVLQRLGYTGPKTIATFPSVLLDTISTDLILSCSQNVGNDLLAHYTRQAGAFLCPEWAGKSILTRPGAFGGRAGRA